MSLAAGTGNRGDPSNGFICSVVTSDDERRVGNPDALARQWNNSTTRISHRHCHQVAPETIARRELLMEPAPHAVPFPWLYWLGCA